MEKNQHNNSEEMARQHHDRDFTQSQPGQQHPANTDELKPNNQSSPDHKEQHSESSFPQQEGETLGTP